MSNKKFKVGDKVKCSHFLYAADNRFIGMVGTFSRYNKYGEDIVYINFGQPYPYEEIGCLTCNIELLSRRNEQLLFNFMLD